MEIFLIWALFAALVGSLASSRGRSGVGYFLLSLILSPLVGLVIVLVTNNLTEQENTERLRQRQHERQLASIQAIAAHSVGASQGSTEGPPQFRSITEELTQLAKLRDKGILTEAEFNSQKASLLRSN